MYIEDTCYEYFEFASKNNQHRFSDIHLRKKCVKAYSSVGSVKCVVKILDCYKKRVPQEPKAFYLRPLDKIPVDSDKHWFINMPVSINTLNNVVRFASLLMLLFLIIRITHYVLQLPVLCLKKEFLKRL